MITTRIETITPQIAELGLKTMRGNRPQTRSHVVFFENLLRSHTFVLTHQGVAFDENGCLLDGQHRYQAIVNTGIPAQMLVTRGLPVQYRNGTTIKTMDCMDCGRGRSVGDQLQIQHGIQNAARAAAAARAILMLSTSDQRARLTTTTAAFIIKQYPEIRTLAKQSNQYNALLTGAVIGALAVGIKSSPELMDTFVEPFCSGNDLKKNSAILVFRNGSVAMTNAGKNRGQTLKKMKLTFNALLAHIEGDPVQRISSTSEAGLIHFLEFERKTLQKIQQHSGYLPINQ